MPNSKHREQESTLTLGDTPNIQKVSLGKWQGERQGTTECFYGVRYARLAHPTQPRSVPVGESNQIAVDDLTEVPIFPQLPSRLEKVLGKNGRKNPQTDDAFYLNVWKPVDGQGLPVIVFIHGGAWITGGGAMAWYRGQRLAGDGAVVITLNYRLGPAGHFAPDDWPNSQAHRPFEDILLALRWVQNHVREFGGDETKVTLAGQSAGAWYTWALSSLPEARGLFQQAALFSIPEIAPWTYEERQVFTHRALSFVSDDEVRDGAELLMYGGISALKEIPAALGAIPTMYMPMLTGRHREMLANAHTAIESSHVGAYYVRKTPHEMSVFLPWDSSRAESNTPLLRALRERLGDQQAPKFFPLANWDAAYNESVGLASWFAFGRFSDAIVAAAAERGIKAVNRTFVAISGYPRFGAVHCIDLPFQFGNMDDWNDAPMLQGWLAEDFEDLSAEIRADLLAFASGEAMVSNKIMGTAYSAIEQLNTSGNG